MQAMSAKPTLLLCNRGTSHILIGYRLHSSTVKIREGFCFEMPRISTAAFVGDPNNIVPASSVESENVSYSSKAIKQHTGASEDEITTTEKLFNREETESVAASADVMGCAEEVLKAAKNSTDLVGECKKIEDIRSEENLVICERSRLTEKEKPEVVKDQFRSQAIEEESNSNVACPHDFPPEFVSKHMAKAIILSQKRAERRARRVKAGVKIIKVAAAGTSYKRNSRSKRTILSLLEFSNEEHVLRDSINSERLTATEEIELSKGIQDLLKLQRIRSHLASKCGYEPTLNSWAEALGTDTKTLQRRFLVGQYCRAKLFRSNLDLVRIIGERYRGLGISSEDLFQIGCFGLVKGVDRFDYRKRFRFSTFARWCIRSPITKALCSSDIVQFPQYFYFYMYRVKRVKRRFYCLYGRRPRLTELGKITGLSFETLRLVSRYTRRRRKYKEDRYADPDAKSPEDIFRKQELRKEVAKSFSCITKREREILRLRYGFDGGRSRPLSEIGELYNFSRERIRQIEKGALRKLRESRSHILRHYVYP